MNRPARNSTEVLQAAKWILENIGWVQGSYQQYDSSGKEIAFCAEGALMAVDTGQNYGARNLAFKRLGKVIGGRSVVAFNDDKKTTKQKVLRAFNKAIKGKK